MTSMPQMSSPSPRALQRVNIQNNLANQRYLLQIEQFERERSLAFSLIDHERLDVRDFLRKIKRCDSDLAPEAQRWMGTGLSRGRKGLPRLRTAKTAPVQFRESSPVHNVIRNVATAPLQRNLANMTIEDDPSKNESGAEQQGDDRISYGFNRNARNSVEVSTSLRVYGAPPTAQTKNTVNPFARRNTYARLAFEETGGDDDIFTHSRENNTRQDDGRDTSCDVNSDTRNTESDTQNIKGKSNGGEKRSVENAEQRRQVETLENAEIMREVMDRKQVSRRRRRRRRTPIEERIRAFYTRLDTMKEREKQEKEAPMSKANQRRWVLLTRGVDAALAESSDEDDQHKTHTV